MFGFLAKLFTPIIKPIANYATQRNKITQIKNEGAIKLAQAKVDGKLKQIMSDSESAGKLDMEAVRQNADSLKDEVLMFVVLVPLVMAFIPSMVQYVDAGFIVLDRMPDYYQYLVGGVFIYVFGFKRILLKAIDMFAKKKLL